MWVRLWQVADRVPALITSVRGWGEAVATISTWAKESVDPGLGFLFFGTGLFLFSFDSWQARSGQLQGEASFYRRLGIVYMIVGAAIVAYRFLYGGSLA